MMRGAAAGGGALITLSPTYNVSDVSGGVPATASFVLEADGDILSDTSSGSTDEGDWLAPKAGMDGFEALATLNSGTLDSGTTDTPVLLGTTRVWNVTQSTPGTQTANLTIIIRRPGGPTLDSTTVDLSAEFT